MPRITVRDVGGNLPGILRASLEGVLDVGTRGPRQALVTLSADITTEATRCEWAERARRRAITGSCPKSHAYVSSGLNCWIAFARKALRMPVDWELPPTIEGLQAWSALFSHFKTFGNYLNYVRMACELAQVPTAVFRDPVLKRTKAAIEKR